MSTRQYHILKSFLFTLSFVLIFTTCDEPEEKDTTPPTVTITSPQNGLTVNELVTITCISTDNKGVEKVELWIDGVSTGVIDETEPYSLEWNTTSFENKSFTITVRSYDVNENMSDSDPITLNVDNSLSNPQSVSITSLVFENGGFNIVWNKSIDGDFGSYELEKSVESTMSNYEIVYSTENVTDTTFFDNDVDPLNYQYYRITVIDTFGYDSKSQIISSSLDPVPISVNISSVTYTLYEMEVEWEESTDDDFMDYKLLYSETENGVKDTIETYSDKSTTTYITTYFDPTHENWFWVLVSDTLGQISIGSGLSHTVDSFPSQINISSVTYDLTEMVVTWETSIDNDFISYELLYSESESGGQTSISTITDINTTSYSINSFDPTQERWYWIKVTDFWGQTSLSNGYMVLENPPIPSELFPIVYENDSFLITWSQNNDDDFFSYTLFESFSDDTSDQTEIFTTNDITSTNYVVTGIVENEYRYYQLIVEDIWGLQTNSFVTGSSDPKVIFTSRFGQNDAIYEEIMIMNYNGSSPIRLTDNNIYDIEPIFTPDGNNILFGRSGTVGTQFFIMDLDGNNQINISNNNRGNSYPNFTNDGLSIVYQSQESNQSPRISIMDIDGSNQTDLLITNNNRYPNLSPDDTKIIFSTWRWGNNEIGMIDIDGSNITRITNTNEVYETHPQYTPDGQNILVIVGVDGIDKMDINGGNRINIVNMLINGNHFDISPDGNKVIFISNNDFYIVDIDGSNLTNIITGLNNMRNPVFSPDGTKIVFNTSDIYMMDIDGTNLVNLTNSTKPDQSPRIQP